MATEESVSVVNMSAEWARVTTFSTEMSPGPVDVSRGMLPLSIPLDQRYYWTSMWQTDEGESLARIDAGEGREFASIDEAIAYLLSANDD